MAKLLLMSTLIALVVAPVRAARVSSSQRSLRRALVSVFVFNIFYWLVVLFGYFHLYLGASGEHLTRFTRY